MVTLVLLQVAVLITKVCYCLLIDFSKCDLGFKLKNLCLEICPSNFLIFNQVCHNFSFQNDSGFLSQIPLNSESSLFLPDENLKDSSFPESVMDMGLQFMNFSMMKFNYSAKFSNEISINFLMLILSSGTLLVDSLKSLELRLEIPFLLVNISEDFVKLNQFRAGFWISLNLNLKETNRNSYIVTSTIDKRTEVYEFQSKKLKNFNTLRFVLGDFLSSGSGFKGFVYRAKIYSFEEKIEDLPILKNCLIDNETLALCCGNKCLDMIDSNDENQKKPRKLLVTCLNPPLCSVTSSDCPLFFILEQNSNCVLKDVSQKRLLLFRFDTSYKVIYDLSPSILSLSPGRTSNTNQISYKRGKYLNGISDYYLSVSKFIFSLNPTLYYWVKPESDFLSPILSKNPSFYLLISTSGLTFYDRYWAIYRDGLFSDTNWIYLKIYFSFINTDSTRIDIYINNVKVVTYSSSKLFLDSNSPLIIGYLQGNSSIPDGFYKGWIYMFAYHDSSVLVSMGEFINKDADMCRYLTLKDDSCITNCELNEFYDIATNSCGTCSNNYQKCRNSNECSTCHDIDCIHCNHSAVRGCNNCLGFVADGFCFKECPLMYSPNGRTCLNIGDYLDLSFNSTTSVMISPSVFTVDLVSNPGQYSDIGGCFFNRSSVYRSSIPFYFGPEYTMSLWIRLISGTSFKFHFENSSSLAGLEFISNQISHQLDSGIEKINFDWKTGSWNIFWFKYYSKKSDQAFSNPNVFFYDLEFYKLFYYSISIGNSIISLKSFYENKVQANRTMVTLFIRTGDDTSAIVYNFRYAPKLTEWELQPSTKSKTLCGSKLCMDIFPFMCADSPTCNVLYNQCPTFFKSDEYSQCQVIDESKKRLLMFHFDTSYSVIYDLEISSFSLVPVSSRVIPMYYKRGKYLSGFNEYFTTNENILLALNCTFKTWFKLESLIFIPIFSKGSNFAFLMSEKGFSLYDNHWVVYNDVSIDISKWVYLKLTITHYNTLHTVIDIYFNEVKFTSHEHSGYYFDTNSPLIIGYLAGSESFPESYFKGWFYMFAYHESRFSFDFGDLIIKDSKSCGFFSILDNNCLENCEKSNFYSPSSGSCSSCPSETRSCKTFQDCSNCYDPNCIHCNRTSVNKCNNCLNYLLDGFCFKTCPLMYSSNEKKCLKLSGKLEISFTSANSISVSPNLFQVEMVKNDAFFMEARGYLFPRNSVYKSSTSFYYGPEYTLSIWAKPVQGVSFRFHFENSFVSTAGFEFLSGKLTLQPGSGPEIINFSLPVSQWNLLTYRYYSNKTEQSRINPNVFFYDFAFSPVYFYEFRLGSALIARRSFEEYKIEGNRTLCELYLRMGEDSAILVYKFWYSPGYAEFDFTPSGQSSVSCGTPSLICMDCPINTFIANNKCTDCISICESCPSLKTCSSYCNGCCKLFKSNCFIQCPTFYAEFLDSCNKETHFTSTFIFNTLNGTVPDSTSFKFSLDTINMNVYPNLNYLSDPIPSKDRGFFMGRSVSTALTSSTRLMFSPDFFIGIWLNPYAYSEILKKKDLITVNISGINTGITLHNISTDNYYYVPSGSGLSLNTWTFLGINNVYDSVSNANTLDLYRDTLKVSTNVFFNIFHDTNDFLIVGAGGSSYYKGWIFKFIYSASYFQVSQIESLIGACSGCQCPSDTNLCLPTCDYNQYFKTVTCESCSPMEVCNSPDRSNLCFHPNCTSCTNFNDCIECSYGTCGLECYVGCGSCSGLSVYDCKSCSNFYFSFLSLCLPRCPDLMTKSDKSCSFSTLTTLNYDFYINGSEVSDVLNKVIFSSSSSTFGYNRGWSTSLVTSSSKFILHPFPSFIVWIKLSTFGQVLVKKDQAGNEDIKLEVVSNSLLALSFSGRNSKIFSDFSIGINAFEWKNFAVKFEMSSQSVLIYLFIDGNSVEVKTVKHEYLFASDNTLFEIGNGSPFYLYRLIYSINLENTFLADNIKKIPDCVYPASLNACLWNCDLLEFLENNKICKQCPFPVKTCKGPLFSDFITCYTYLHGICTDSCPNFYSNISGVCTIETAFSLDFIFSSLNPPVMSSNGIFAFDSPSHGRYPTIGPQEPTASFKRGFYFEGQSLSTTTTLSFSNRFSIEFWLNAYDLRSILERTKLTLTISSLGVTLNLKMLDNLSFAATNQVSIFLYNWLYIGVTLSATQILDAQIFVNRQVASSSQISGYFLDISEILTLGTSFKGWVYRFKYSAVALDSSLLLIYKEAKPEVWNCPLGSFFNGRTCAECKNKCNCRRPNDCTLCSDPLCEECSDYSSTCTKCSDSAEFVNEFQECRLCSRRCAECKYYLSSCNACRAGYVKNYDSTCMIYCSDGDEKQDNLCLKLNNNIFSFTFQKVNLPYKTRDFIVKFGISEDFYPNYDTFDPRIYYQRGLYFNKSLVEVDSTVPGGYLKLSNRQTFDFYFNPSSDGTILAYTTDKENVISASVSSGFITVEYCITDTFILSPVSLKMPVVLNQWTRMYWTLNFNNQRLDLTILTSKGTSFINSTFNKVFYQSIGGYFSIGSVKKSDFFTGFLYMLSVDNYPRPLDSFAQNCPCQMCTSLGDCLSECNLDEFYNKTCFKCLETCTFGCSSNSSCSLHKDPLCTSFNWLNDTCELCFGNTSENLRPCKCIEGAYPNAMKQVCECPEGEIIYNNRCDMCTRYLRKNDVSAYFLSNFMQIHFNFSLQVVKVTCRDLFDSETIAKFGIGFECLFDDDSKGLLVTLGANFRIVEETIRIQASSLKGAAKECGFPLEEFSVKIEYLESPPMPVAKLKVADPLLIACQDLFLDGSLSTGQVLSGLLYKWEFKSTIIELSNFTKDFIADSFVRLGRDKLKEEIFTVKLTVKNRFGLTNSTDLKIELILNQSMTVEFDQTIEYSCEFSKSCQFFIQKVTTCIPSPQLSFEWQVSTVDLFLNSSQINYFRKMQLASDGLYIPAKFFPYGEINFTFIATEKKSGMRTTNFLIVNIKPDPFTISLSKTPGSVDEDKDLVVDVILPPDLDPSIIFKFYWTCYYFSELCSFPYNQTSSTLLISKKYSKLRLYTNFVLNVSSYIKFQRRMEEVSVSSSVSVKFKCEIVSGSVPEIKLIQENRNINTKIISSQSPAKFKAIFLNNDYKSYSFQWDLVSQDRKSFLSSANVLVLALNPGQLIQGKQYELKFSTQDHEDRSCSFFYDFQVNIPPKFGLCSVNPSSGLELSTEFFVSCTDWQDLDRNYPISYSFGITNDNLNLFFIIFSPLSYFSMNLPFLNKNVLVFARVYDSIEDYSQISISVDVNQDGSKIMNLTEKVLKELESALTTEIPNQLICLSASILNRDLYTTGNFSIPTPESLIELNQCFGIMLNALSNLVNQSLFNTQLFDLALGILEEMTKNPWLISDGNLNSTLSFITNLLSKASSLGVTEAQASSIMTSITNSISFKSDTLYNNTKSVQAIENLLNILGKEMMKESIPSIPLQASSDMLSLSSVTFDKTTVIENFEISSEKASSIIPQEVFLSVPDIETLGIFCGQVKSTYTKISLGPYAVLVSVFNTRTGELLSIPLNQSSITLKIPVSNTYLIKEPGCFYLNSTHQWSETGCKVLEIGTDYLKCSCNHLSLFSAGDKVEGGFIPSNNFDQTIDVSVLNDLKATSALGFYFIAFILFNYMIIGFIAWKKDSKDFQEIIDNADMKNAQNILNNIHVEELVVENHSIQSLINEGQIIENQTKEDRIQRQIMIKVEELKRSTKSGWTVILENHRLLNIMFYNDPKSLRFTRCTLLFLLFLGKMYFIGLFYEKETKKDGITKVGDVFLAYSYRDFLVMVYSIGIVAAVDYILGLITKKKVIGVDMPREIILLHVKSNQRRRYVTLAVCGALMIYYCWSIVLFTLNFEISVSSRWIFNTGLGIGSDIFVNPFVKLFIKGFILAKIILYLKLRKLNVPVVQSLEHMQIIDEKSNSNLNIEFSE